MNDIINQKEKASLFFRYAMHYGLQLGIILFISLITGLWGGMFAGISNILFLITPFILYRYIKKYRENVLTNQITYSQAWSFGNITFFFASLILTMGIYLLLEYFSPGLLQTFIGILRNPMSEVLQQDIPFVTGKPIEIAVFFGMLLCSMGMFLSAVVAIFAKKKNTTQIRN